MGQARQTVERLQLGLTLQRLRLAADKTQPEAANVIGKSAARLSQVENGKGALKAEELARLLDFYGVTPEQRATVLALGRACRRRQPRLGYLDTLPDSYLRFTDMLAAARRIGWYEAGGIMPGLVQSEPYVRALMEASSGIWTEAEKQERIDFRLDTQRRVLESPNAEQIDIVFTEEALLRVVGDPAVMSKQVRHLLHLPDQHPGLSIRIVPLDVGNNPWLGGGMVTLEFANADPITFVPSVWGPALYFDQRVDTAPMRQLFATVLDIALTAEASSAALVEFLARRS
ncbi:helix-turn-helix transcriptional regulator [Lentzea sp. NPDC051838]|uniref:helix-turn-helix domain-containing protein n=1 Tax=Lentzea sp. NPDC051838 TaxID=3154849 RepID=UPI0034169EC2